MGTSLSGLTPADTYQSLIKVGDNSALSATLKTLSDGAGNDLPIQVSTTAINFTGNVGVYNKDIISSNATPNRTTKLNASGLYLSRLSDGTYPNSITADGSMFYDARGNHIFRSDTTPLLEISNPYQNVTIGSASAISGGRLVVKGSGSTSATTSLLVQNSSGNDLFKILDSAVQNAFMYSYPASNNGGLTLQATTGTTQSPGLTFKPNTGLNSAKIYVDANKIYFSLINTNAVDSYSVYVFATDNRKAKFGVTPDDSTYDSSIYAKAIWDGGAAGHFRSFSATQTSNILEVANYDNSSNFINVSATGNLRVGNGAVDTARLSIKGSGSTFATTSLLVQNSAGNRSLETKDNGDLWIGNTASNMGAVIVPYSPTFADRVFMKTSDGFPLFSTISNALLEISCNQFYTQGNMAMRNANQGIIGTTASSINNSSIQLTTSVNSYGGTSQDDACNLLYIKNNGVTLQANGSVNFIKLDGQVNEAGGGGAKWCTGIYYNPTLTGGTLLANSHYCYHATSGQMMVNTTSPQSSAQLQVDSTTRGFLPPRMTDAQVRAIVSPAVGLEVYNTTLDCPVFYSSTGWRKVSHSVM